MYATRLSRTRTHSSLRHTHEARYGNRNDDGRKRIRALAYRLSENRSGAMKASIFALQTEEDFPNRARSKVLFNEIQHFF